MLQNFTLITMSSLQPNSRNQGHTTRGGVRGTDIRDGIRAVASELHKPPECAVLENFASPWIWSPTRFCPLRHPPVRRVWDPPVIHVFGFSGGLLDNPVDVSGRQTQLNVGPLLDSPLYG